MGRGVTNHEGVCGEEPRWSGSETRDLLKEQAEIRVKHRQGSETRQVSLRGDQ